MMNRIHLPVGMQLGMLMYDAEIIRLIQDLLQVVIITFLFVSPNSALWDFPGWGKYPLCALTHTNPLISTERTGRSVT